jgi:MoCo/4Fe-4S cofactor protein with predicted Tat translocation signal
MSEKKYWKSFGELNLTESYVKETENEFREDLPMESLDSKGLLDTKTPRRDFLKYLGFSTAAATLAASCEMPVRHIVPYVIKPENMIPGVADYYATTFISGGDAVSIIAKVRDGRPIKLEGNELSTVTKGGTSARVQASILDLYDTARLRFPVQMVKGVPQQVTSFEAFDKLVMDSMAGQQAGITVLLTPTITSVTTKQIIADALSKYQGSLHVQYDADSFSGMLLANEASYGKRAIPSYHFDNAKVIVSLGADFLGTWLSPIEFARQYASGRKIDEKAPGMNRHYQFESMLSLTGSNADERFVHMPSDSGAVAVALLSALGGNVPSPVLPEKLKTAINKAGKDLLANKGKALVVSGSNNVQVQTVINAINEAIGANGTTITWDAVNLTRQGIDSDFVTLVNDMNQGKIGTLLVYDVNPVYDSPDSKNFKAGLAKVKTTVSFSGRLDETTELCKFVLPSPHFLERWGDAQPKSGYISMMQPVIAPLFLTRPFEDSLMIWSGNKTSYDDYFKQYWTSKLGSHDGYEKALQDGVLERVSATAVISTPSTPYLNMAGNVEASASSISSMKKGGQHQLVLYQQVSMGVGAQSHNPWLLELPDPVTRGTWDNYAMVSPNFIKEQYGIDLNDHNQSDRFESHPERQVIRIKGNGTEITIPVLAVPGMPDGVFAIALGYGRQSADPKNTGAYIGRAAVDAGKNAFPFASNNGTTVEWFVPDVSFEKTTEEYKIAQVQIHGSYEGRTSVIKELTLSEFVKEPDEILDDRKKEMSKFGGIENYDTEGTLYPYFDKPGIHWGMQIDLNSCVGCGNCVVACIAENNVTIVGKSEVLRFHDMHWLRIDRYFSGNLADPDSIQTIFQPMLCQHCDNAPCENVCPVSATNHSTEGLNQMAYNRCIGTRYCANNCPFKVRRFNWEDYTGADSFPNNQDENGVGKLSDAVLMMNEELPRMVLNPDVTVRSRGVMEKCSFCVQRLQDGKLRAKKENRVLNDGDVKTACQQSCPTQAIQFGNVNNSKSAIVKDRQDNEQRLYHVLEELHVLPNITYLAKVRNPESEAKEKA